MAKGAQRPLAAGDLAPEATFYDDLGYAHPLRNLLAEGPVLLAFLKVSCPVCQLALPYLQRISGPNLRVIPISQDTAAATLGFSQAFGLQLPALFDREDDDYPASNAYRITNVPSMFLVDRNRRIEWESVGFSKRELEALAQRAGRPIFSSGDMVPEFKPG